MREKGPEIKASEATKRKSSYAARSRKSLQVSRGFLCYRPSDWSGKKKNGTKQ